MGRLKPSLVTIDEGVDIRHASPADLLAEVENLHQPWIADEGPLAANFRQHRSSSPKETLQPKGLAFDHQTTITWDEEAVQVIRSAAHQEDVLARRSQVLVRARFSDLESVFRIDYLCKGVLLASRYQPATTTGKGDSADA